MELLEAFSDQAALAIDNARLLKHARQRERYEQELRIAAQIQRKLLPRKPPEVPGLELRSARGEEYRGFARPVLLEQLKRLRKLQQAS